MAWFERFTRPWAATGQVSSPSDAQADAGFAFLGINPPTAELFNALFQDGDQKHRWLFENLRRVMAEAALAPTAANTDALFAAIRALILAQTDPLRALRNTDVGNLNAANSAQDGRLGALEGKTGGRLITVRAYDRRGVYRHAFVPTCALVVYELVGAGAAGGGGPIPPAGQALAGSGGGSGGYTSGLLVNPLANGAAFVDITVGAGGAPQQGNNGLPGGATSFGAWAAALGGSLGSTSGFVSGQGIGFSGPGAPPGSVVARDAVSGGIRISGGAPGHSGIVLGPTNAIGGAGGAGPWGGAGSEVGQNSSGANASGYGGGGGGCCLLAGQGPGFGGAGSDGHAMVWEFT